MLNKTYILISRAQPWHNGHQEISKYALSKADTLLILVGSINKARDVKNPFTFDERKSMIEKSVQPILDEYLSKGIEKKLIILGVEDNLYNNNKWLFQVQQLIEKNINPNNSVYLTGYEKDSSSSYLKYFPQWKKDFYYKHFNLVNATDIRADFFDCDYQLFDKTKFEFSIPEPCIEFLFKFTRVNKGKEYLNLKEEYKFILKYRKQFENLKYNVPFLTGDAITVCCGHVLLVQRRSYPGKGLLAIPGGFVDSDKDLDQVSTAIRELKEETKIKVPEGLIKGSIKKISDFSDPSRSLRWRIFTKAILIQLPDQDELPKVKGADDAQKAFWMPINEIVKHQNQFFEDHYNIITTMLSI